MSIRTTLLLGLSLLATLMTTTAMSQSSSVDDWQGDMRVNTAPSDRQTQGGSLERSDVIGGWRNVYVEAFTTSNASTLRVRPDTRDATFNNEDGATGLIRVFWDGSQRYSEPNTQGAGDNNVLDPLDNYLSNGVLTPPAQSVQDPGSADGGSVNPVGLGGVDLTTSGCNGTDGIHMLFGTTDQGTVTVDVDVFTDGDEWSRATASQSDGEPKVLSFYFNGNTSESNVFSPMGGSNNDQGATFTSVGAIVLSVEVSTDAVDVPFSTPIVLGCGMDQGDAPVFGEVGNDTRVSYRTLVQELSNISFWQDGTNVVELQNGNDPETSLLRGPHHTIGGPFLGLGSNDTDSEDDGQPNSGATGDDSDVSSTGTDDEAAVTLSDLAIREDGGVELQSCAGIDMGPNEGRENWYCAEVEVSNPTNEWAQAVGWIDFRNSGSFDNLCGTSSDGVVQYGDLQNPGNDFCERSSATLLVGEDTNGDGTLSAISGDTCDFASSPGGTELDQDNSNSFTGGNVPPGCEGTVVMTWDLSNVLEDLTLNETFARFRISTDSYVNEDGSSFFGSQGPTPFGYAADGEVEDHAITAGTLPVSISGFEARKTSGGLEVSWSTVSETENVGFYLWDYSGGELELLTPDMIPSKTSDAADPQNYSYTVSRSRGSEIGQLAITAVDNRGKEEMYGLFDVDQRYGRSDASTPIDWDSIRTAAEARLASLGFQRMGETWRADARDGKPVAADFLVSEEGMQRITHDDLMAAGIDLRGQRLSRIAVTVDGQPVPRSIETLGRGDSFKGSRWGARSRTFSERSVIEFWGEKPSFPNARYVDDLVYRVELNRGNAIAAGEAPEGAMIHTSREYTKSLRHDDDNEHMLTNVMQDPWVMARLSDGSPSTQSHTSTFDLPKYAIDDSTSRIEVRLAGANDMAAAPDHHVQVKLNGSTVAEEFFDGRTARTLTAEVPTQDLSEQGNEVTIVVPGGTESPLDAVYLESVELQVPVATRAENDRILIGDYEPGNNVTADGFLESGRAAWAWNGERLLAVPTEVGGRGMIRSIPPAEEGYELWISSANALHRPEPLGAIGDNRLLDQAGDFLVIAHPAFMPASAQENHPLNDFVAERANDGWNVRLLDITEIQAQYGGGMPLPQAVRRFLAAADKQFDYEHVLLVGDDTYDYRNILELGSVSFIPTVYAATNRIPHTPSDGLLADIDGDGVADKAIGRWPVRTLDDLESIVHKTLDWSGTMEGLRNAVWVADMEDPNQMSFQAQASRLMDQLVDAGWAESEIDSVFLDDVASADAGRDQLFGLLEQGRAFTGFVGHGAPSMWTFDGLLVPNDLAELDNFGLPTMISTSTCYTSYFVSPYSETVAHRWMNGYDEDAQGNPIAGARNGAVAIHGAATLSNYQQNEFVVSKVQSYQLEGMTLGQAVLKARQDAADRGLRDQVINWGLLGDPTLAVD